MKVNGFSMGTVSPYKACACRCYTDAGFSGGFNGGAANASGCGGTCLKGDSNNNHANYNLAYSEIKH